MLYDDIDIKKVNDDDDIDIKKVNDDTKAGKNRRKILLVSSLLIGILITKKIDNKI